MYNFRIAHIIYMAIVTKGLLLMIPYDRTLVEKANKKKVTQILIFPYLYAIYRYLFQSRRLLSMVFHHTY